MIWMTNHSRPFNRHWTPFLISLYAIIFVSGASVLALELLASRIMTPYFGVSLYIWTGILSITLVSLALGYWLGGKFAGHREKSVPLERLALFYALIPSLAASVIVVACLVYPFVFSPLAQWNLVLGAFVACLILLFLPLVATSALNPLLVAILLRGAGHVAGDAGVGKVFSVSTIGSVAGVLATAFGIIPYINNYDATLLVAIALASLSLVAALVPSLPLARRSTVMAVAFAVASAACVLLWQADAYTGRMDAVSFDDKTWRVEASFGSLFGTVKILKSDPDPKTGNFLRIYFQDGIRQNTVDSNHRSLSFYTSALEALVTIYRPELKSALVLGLGAGIVPMRLAERGVKVDVVEINPDALRIARDFFGFDPAQSRVHYADARTFVHSCAQRFDVIVVDLFHGDGMPEYLVTREFFRDLKNCLASGGVAVFNTFADMEESLPYAHFLMTLQAELPHLTAYLAVPGARHTNGFVVSSAESLTPHLAVALDFVGPVHYERLKTMLASPLTMDASLRASGRIVTDAYNSASRDLALSQINFRRRVLETVPPQLLIN